jgi:hypothetical protein
MPISREIEFAHIDDLLLDPRNPRLGRRVIDRLLPQSEILELVRVWDLEELAVSFIESGFWPQEAVIAVRDPEVDLDHLVVAEGNRRLGALKLLQNAVAGSPRSRKWAELGEQVVENALFERIPYLLADSRDDIRKFLGFRHVTGIKEWAPAEKAQYIASLIDSGMSYQEVMRAIGSKTPTVRRNYIAYNILRQLDDLEDADVDKVEDRFSVLFLALREHGVQEFLDVDPNAEPHEAREPVAGEEYLRNLEHFIRWVFGTQEVPPLFSDSRYMTKFAKILESTEAVEYLKTARSPSIATAAARAGADTDDLVARLAAATDELEQSLSTVHLYVEDDSVRLAVARLTRGFDALLNSFPHERLKLCGKDE